ncbi:Hypothetical protein CINCED_3A023551 [Cinara cedri]|uniref:Uncharacterized protein n=1 Tax=Cinara cedri TaxID=506608 RepID=A0A5E4MFA4_9HEMI|nr:Hypothetical protein CINCED_3A023551 [Cinara cedri]
MEHDFYYEKHKDTKSRHKANLILENIAKDIYKNPETSLSEKTAAFVTSNIMKLANNQIGTGNQKFNLTETQIKKLNKSKKEKKGSRSCKCISWGISLMANTIIERKHKIAAEKEQDIIKKWKKFSIMLKLYKLDLELKRRKDIIVLLDELPIETLTNGCGILNLNNSGQKGSHWVAWIKHENLNIYFDSYGNANPPKELVKYLRENNLKITPRRFQDNNPPICGYFRKYLKNNNTEYEANSNVQLDDNFVAFLFSQIEVTKNGTLIDQIENVGELKTMMHLYRWISSTSAASDVGKVIIENFEITISSVEYQEIYKIQLINELTKLSQGNINRLNFKPWQCMDETNLNGKTFKRNIASTYRNVYNPLFASVAFQTNGLETQLRKASVFDHCNVKNIWLEIDG